MRIRQSAAQEYEACRGRRRRRAQLQNGKRQRRVVPGVVMGVWWCRAFDMELKGQRVVVMVPLARLVHQGVIDLQ